MATPRRRPPTPLLLIPGGFALLVGMDAGLTLAGAPAPLGDVRISLLHGPLMVLGFLGTVISMERAVALRAGWAYLAPACTGLGALALVFLDDATLGRLLLAQGMLTLVAVYVAFYQRSRDLTVASEGMGAVLGAAAAFLLLRVDVAVVLPLLIGFIVLTIASERVALARIHMPITAGWTLIFLALVLAVTTMVAAMWAAHPWLAGWSGRAVGLALLVITAWLSTVDVARKTVRMKGMPRFSAFALLAGYLWLAVAALALLVSGSPRGAAYDIAIHATFLGFAMSMVLAHAPVILPSVIRVNLPYHPAMWLPLVLLHVTLAARVVSVAAHELGLQLLPAWQAALLGNVAALLIFILTAVVTSVRARGDRPIQEVKRHADAHR